MEAADIYTTGIGKRVIMFSMTDEILAILGIHSSENDFFEAVYIDWENRKTEEIDGQPLTYYLTILGW